MEINDTPNSWFDVKEKLNNTDEVYGWVLDDLESLDKMTEDLDGKIKSGGWISNELYLITIVIPVLLVSKLEYILKKLGRIEKQHEIVSVIRDSTALEDLEKDWLIYLFLVRHTLVHAGGYYDTDFFRKIDEHINRLQFSGKLGEYIVARRRTRTTPIPQNLPSPIAPDMLKNLITLTFKFILFDLAEDALTPQDKVAIERELGIKQS